MSDATHIVNDPTMTPLAVNLNGDLLVTGTNPLTFIIVRSTLRNRGPNALGPARDWMQEKQETFDPSVRLPF